MLGGGSLLTGHTMGSGNSQSLKEAHAYVMRHQGGRFDCDKNDGGCSADEVKAEMKQLSEAQVATTGSSVTKVVGPAAAVIGTILLL